MRARRAAGTARLRDQYLLDPNLVYLNHASIGTIPRAVSEAHAAYIEICESRPSLYAWGGWDEVIETVRSRAAGTFGCAPDDLALTHNTTEAFSIVARGLPLGAGDEVLSSSLNHISGAVAWNELAAARGFTTRRFELSPLEAARMSADELVARHAEAVGPRTRVLVLPHLDNMIALRHPIAAIAAAVRERGVRWVFVDGAQSAGMIPLDVASYGVDLYGMSAHKWVQGPKGLGFLYITPQLRAEVPRLLYKHPGSEMDGTARDYEDYSTRAWPSVVALGDALDFQEAIGAPEKERRYRALHAHLRALVAAEPALEWRSPETWESGSMIVAVHVRGAPAMQLAPRLMAEHGIDVRPFGGALDAIRISPNLATTEEEIERAVRALAAAAV
jgi:selenocysteine lyase/cysteine desulfurase